VRATILGLLLAPAVGVAQQAPTARVTVHVEAEALPLVRAQVTVGSRSAITNAAGVAPMVLPMGEQLVRVRHIGFRPDSLRITVTPGRDTTISFVLEPAAEELEQMFVTSTRGVKRLEDEPTRIEVLGGDDVAEKTEMRPQDLKGFLTEMAGVRMQTTSAATGAAGVRLQGLRPRYSLILADGLPLYGNGGIGLDLLQMPPADLRQIEVVKGPASALYGPSALAGTINLVSKRPGDESDLLVHGTSEAGANAFGWISKKTSDRFGYTGVVGAHTQAARDGDADGWSELPKVRRVELRPRLFFDTPAGGSALLTLGGTFEDREGGFNTGRAAPDGSAYVETADTRRGDVGLTASRVVGAAGVLQFRGSLNVSGVERTFATDSETVDRHTGFAEVSYSLTKASHEILVGGTVEEDAAKASGIIGAVSAARSTAFDYTFRAPAVFVQDAWKATDYLALTGSARLDAHSAYGTWLSPRLSALITPVEDWSLRLSATRGIYAPTPFVEEADPIGVRHVMFNCGALTAIYCPSAEHADYGSADLHGTVGPVEVNATVFGSIIAHPVITQATGDGRYTLVNAAHRAMSRGFELFGVYDLEPLFITALYSFTDAREPLDANVTIEAAAPYAPRHAGGVDITWEDAERGTWIAVESFFTSRQRLVDDPYLPASEPYTLTGILVSQRVGRFKLFANVENLMNVRQTSEAPLVLPSRASDGRWTVAPWGPLEGRIFSVGLRISSGANTH
jgi:outer membrane receptor for ferrienterochelin and colicins